ncbi:hypothetical protein QR680_014878 [Steinernema hermaphroditum]|uniref:Uncharacterized protein n=1 Tax=Steinernema hermaphroditum TaxID=289476 RepID=A0AA39IAE7_9BILA|nr:hypothetical protein QR680_014878 [Steinernema hermaphroditum]
MGDAVPEINLVRERVPEVVQNVRRYLLMVASVTQLLFAVLGSYHLFLRLYGSFHVKKCYAFESLDQCEPLPPEPGWEDIVAISTDVVVFFVFPVNYLIGLVATISFYRNPRALLMYKAAPYQMMYPALLTTAYYYCAVLVWNFGAYNEISKIGSAPVDWIRLMRTNFGTIGMLHVLISVALSIRLCQLLHHSTLDTLRMMREIQQRLNHRNVDAEDGQ